MSSPYTVTATIFDPSATGVVGNAYLRFSLRNFDGSVPIVSSTGVFVETQLDAFPGAGGAISQSIVGNNNITPANTYWQIQYWNNGRITSSGNYFIDGNTNLNTASTISPSPIPGPPNTIVFENNGAMNSSQTKLNLESTDASIVITDEGAGTINLQTSGAKKWPGNWFGTVAPISGSSVFSAGAEHGTAFSITGETTANATNAPTATQMASVPLVNNNTADSAGIYDSKLVTPGIVVDWIAKVALIGTTNSRYWIGFSDVAAAPTTAMVSNTPSQNIIGFRWTYGTDTNIQAVCQTDSTHQTLVDTGVAPTPSTPQILEIVPVSSSSITFYINGTLVATISTNVPANTTVMRNIFLGDSSNISDVWELDFYYFWELLSQ